MSTLLGMLTIWGNLMTTLQIFCVFFFSASSLHLSLDRINLERISTEKRRPIFSRPGQKREFRSRRLQETSIYVHGNFTIDFTSSRLFFPRFPPRCHGHTYCHSGGSEEIPLPTAGSKRTSFLIIQRFGPPHSLTHFFILFYFSLVLLS